MQLRSWIVRLFGVCRRSEEELQEELAAHLAMAEADLQARGLDAEAAARQARIQLGGVSQTREAFRSQMRPPLVDSIIADLRYTARQLRRNPAYSIVAVVTLALGIGCTTAIYTLLDSILREPLPFAQQSQLIKISGFYPKGWVQAVQQRTQTLSGVMSYSLNTEHNVAAGSLPERLFGANVSVNAFDVLGVAPALGRSFNASEAVAGQDRVVILSNASWKQTFAGDGSVVGKQIRIDGVPHVVVGIMPASFNFPDADTRFWLPVSFRGGDPIDPWAMFTDSMIGRLRPGVAPQQVQAEMRALHPQLLKLFPWQMPDNWNADVTAQPLLAALVDYARPRLFLLLAAVVVLLLAACANVANLMIARASQRQPEFAMRSALGATRGRLLRQMLTESLLLGSIAACLGCVLSVLALHGLKATLPPDLPRLADVHVHVASLLFLVALTLATAVSCGLAPALLLRSDAGQASVQGGNSRQSAGPKSFRLASALVVLQMAFAVIAIAGASLMLRSLWHLVHQDPGFRTQSVLSARVSLDGERCSSPANCSAFFDALITRLQQQYGVAQAAVVSQLPLSGVDDGWAFDAEDHPRSGRQTPDQASNRVVSQEYFSLLGIHLERGRLLDANDASSPTHAVVINHAMAQRLWPNADPVGKRIELVGEEKQQGRLDENALTVVGVVQSTRHASLEAPLSDELYSPLSPKRVQAAMSVLIRMQNSQGESRDLSSSEAATLRRVVSSLDPTVSVSQVLSLDEVVGTSASSQRSLSLLISAFALLVGVIGCVGVYSLSAYMVTMRTKELGIRLAMGATRREIAALVVRQGLRLALLGGSAGLIVALLGAFALRSYLFATSPVDPVVMAVIPVTLGAIALLACGAPAWRAAHTEPLTVLRADS